MYNILVENYFFSLEHAGVLDPSEKNTVCFQNGFAGQGAVVELSIRCDDCGLIKSAYFKARGNPYLIASMEWLCRQLEGEPLAVHPRLDYQRLIELFEIPDTKYSVVLMVEDSYTEVIRQMKECLNMR